MRDLPHYLGLPYTSLDRAGALHRRQLLLHDPRRRAARCQSHGDSPEEARAHLEEAKALFLASMIEDGIVVSEALS